MLVLLVVLLIIHLQYLQEQRMYELVLQVDVVVMVQQKEEMLVVLVVMECQHGLM